jgi:C4-dicarboxylate-specific signal transduction histidine kinase
VREGWRKLEQAIINLVANVRDAVAGEGTPHPLSRDT